MPREKHKWLKPRGERTDVEHWGGPIRKSDEGPVMGPEQRDRVRWLHQRATGNGMKRCMQQQRSRITLTRSWCTTPTKRSKPMRVRPEWTLSLIHISEPTRLGMISYAVFCLKK